MRLFEETIHSTIIILNRYKSIIFDGHNARMSFPNRCRLKLWQAMEKKDMNFLLRCYRRHYFSHANWLELLVESFEEFIAFGCTKIIGQPCSVLPVRKNKVLRHDRGGGHHFFEGWQRDNKKRKIAGSGKWTEIFWSVKKSKDQHQKVQNQWENWCDKHIFIISF